MRRTIQSEKIGGAGGDIIILNFSLINRWFCKNSKKFPYSVGTYVNILYTRCQSLPHYCAAPLLDERNTAFNVKIIMSPHSRWSVILWIQAGPQPSFVWGLAFKHLSDWSLLQVWWWNIFKQHLTVQRVDTILRVELPLPLNCICSVGKKVCLKTEVWIRQIKSCV